MLTSLQKGGVSSKQVTRAHQLMPADLSLDELFPHATAFEIIIFLIERACKKTVTIQLEAGSSQVRSTKPKAEQKAPQDSAPSGPEAHLLARADSAFCVKAELLLERISCKEFGENAFDLGLLSFLFFSRCRENQAIAALRMKTR